MTVPGMGGQQPPSQGTAASGQVATGIQPGVSNIQFVRLLIVSGPSAAVNGIFIYQPGTKPAAGNGPVLSGTQASKDPFGNTVQQGWVSYAAPGSNTYAELLNAQLALNIAGMSSPALVAMLQAGQIAMTSGDTAAGDSPAGVVATSKNANSGARLVSLVADQVQLTAGSSANIPLAHLSQFPISGAATLATTIAAVNALYAALVTAQVFAS